MQGGHPRGTVFKDADKDQDKLFTLSVMNAVCELQHAVIAGAIGATYMKSYMLSSGNL